MTRFRVGPWPATARRLARAVAGAVAIGLVASPVIASTPAQAAILVPVNGVGSTWSKNALVQWATNLQKNGLKINYDGQGSTVGRNQFRVGQADFAVSEIPYGVKDQGTQESDPPPARGFAYMPIVAGGTSFMYNLKIGGRRVTNLRLSGEVVTKIFTGVITSWDDPAIKADNPGLSLPKRKVVPVVRSDGSGTTAQFTTWMASEHGALWNAYCAKNGRHTPCGVTSSFPIDSTKTAFVGQGGSDRVSAYVASDQAEGAITYVEYSYPLNAGFPVAKVLNHGGYYTEPTARPVAVGLTGATINPADLTQELTNVYRNKDKRAYPLSSYSYMVLPTTLETPMSPDKGYTLGVFAYYFLCEGQGLAESLGYSPLPINLVTAGMTQVARIPGVEKKATNLKGCNNPTFSEDGTNTLAVTAPNPPECDRRGPTQCGPGGAPGTAQGNDNQSGNNANGSAGPGASGAPNAGVDPDTGEPLGADGSAGGQSVAGGQVLLAAERGWGLRHTMMVLAGILLAGLVVGPPLVARRPRPRSDDDWGAP